MIAAQESENGVDRFGLGDQWHLWIDPGPNLLTAQAALIGLDRPGAGRAALALAPNSGPGLRAQTVAAGIQRHADVQLLLKILQQTHWDTAKAAELLRVSRGTIYYRLKKYGINVKEASRPGFGSNR